MRRSGNRKPNSRPPLVLHIGREEIVIRKRYETASIANDVLIGLWFLIGSILFFSPETSRAGTWLFVVGSVEMLIRPLIRLTGRIHLGRYHPDLPAASRGVRDI